MNSQGAKREDLRLYLLGLISAEERQSIEERIITNQSDHDEVLIVEEELIDDYLAGKLNETERQAFDTHFMNPPDRQEDLRFAQALKTYISTSNEDVIELTEPVSKLSQSNDHFTVQVFAPSLWVRFSLVAASLVLVGVLSWIGYRYFKPQGPPQIIAVTLKSGAVTREGGSLQTVTLPAAGEISVHFSLPVPPAPFEIYQAVLRDAAGTVILRSDKSRRSVDQRIVVPVPGDSLPAGDYQFVLNGIDEKGDSDSVASYRFKVVR